MSSASLQPTLDTSSVTNSPGPKGRLPLNPERCGTSQNYMKIDIKTPGTAGFETRDLSLEAVSAQLRTGIAIRAPLPEEPAEFVAVAIPVWDGKAAKCLEHPFTKAHASLVGASETILTLLFTLEQPIANVKQYRLLQMGLAAKYLGALPIRSVDQAFAGISGLTVQITAQALTKAACEHLLVAGKEQIFIQKADGYLRSSICVEADEVLDSEYGHELPLARVPDGEHLRCPFHIGGQHSAEVLTLADGQRALACHGCKRLFGPTGAARRYDFGAFDRVVRDLPSEADDQITRLTSKYLPGGLVQGEGVWLIKSPKGSGKTELLREVIANARSGAFDSSATLPGTHGKVLLLGHRRTLLHSMAKRLGLDCYMMPVADALSDEPMSNTALLQMDDVELSDSAPCMVEEDGGIVRVDPTAFYAVCLDSLPVLDPGKHRYPVVLIDECEQVFAHLVGSTLKDRRSHVFKLMEHYLRVAKQVILLDADLGMITMQTLLGMNLRLEASIRFIVNEPTEATGALKLYEDGGQLVEVLKQAVRDGKKTFVAVNAKQKAKELARALVELNPGKRIEVVHADNAQSLGIQRLLKNLTVEFEGSLDVLIASPALATGVDISFFDKDGNPRTVVEQVFGLFRNNITTHFEIDQHLFRVRHPKEVHVWVDRAEMNYEPDPAAIRVELLKTVARHMVLLGYKDDGTPVMSDDALLDIWTEVKAVQRGSKNRLRQAFTDLRRRNHSEVLSVDVDQEATKAGKKTMREARQQRIDAEALCIEGAEDLDDDSLHKLQQRLDDSMPISEDEHWAVRKAWLAKFYKVAVDAELVQFDDDGGTRRAIQNLELMLTETAQDASRRAVDSSVQQARRRTKGDRSPTMNGQPLIFDRPMAASKREVLRGLTGATGLFNPAMNSFSPARVVRHRDLRPFVQLVEKERHRLVTLFDMSVRADLVNKPMQQLGQILMLVGLRLKQAGSQDADGAKVREYQLDENRIKALQEVIERRRETAASGETEDKAITVTRRNGPSAQMVSQIKAWRR